MEMELLPWLVVPNMFHLDSVMLQCHLEFDVGLALGTEELDEGLLGVFVALGTEILVGFSLSISSILPLFKIDFDIST